MQVTVTFMRLRRLPAPRVTQFNQRSNVKCSRSIITLLCTVPVGLLDSSGGGGGLPCGLGSQLLPWGLSSGGLASGLLGASHVDLSEGISDFWKYVSLKFRF